MSSLSYILGPEKKYDTYHSSVYTNNLYANTIIASDINFGSITYNTFAASDAALGYVAVGQVDALTINVNNLYASDITTENITANNGYINTVRSSDGYFFNLTVDTLNAANLSFSAAAVSDLTTGNLTTNNLYASDIVSNTAIINIAEIYQLESSDIRVGNLTIDDTLKLQNSGDANYVIINSLSTGSKLLSLPSITQASDIIVSNTSTSTLSSKTLTSPTNTVYSKGLFGSSDRVLTTTSSYPLAVGDVLAYTGSDLQFTTPSFTQASDIRVGNIKIDDNLWVQNNSGSLYTKIFSNATSDVNILIPNPSKVDETFMLLDLAQTTTNKTITDVSNTVYAKGLKTSSDVNLLTSNSHPTASGQSLMYNGTNNLQWSTPTITVASDLHVGNLWIDNTFKLQNAANSNYTTIQSNQSFTNTISIPITVGSTDTLVTDTSASTMTNKTITDSSNTVYAKGFKTSSDTTLLTTASTPTTTNQVLTYDGTNNLKWQAVSIPNPPSTLQAGLLQTWQVGSSDAETYCYDYTVKTTSAGSYASYDPIDFTKNLGAIRSKRLIAQPSLSARVANGIISTPYLYMGPTANLGGFTYGAKFGIPTGNLGQRGNYFVGATANAYLTASDLPTQRNMIGFGCDTSDTNFQFIYSGATSFNKVDTGFSCRNIQNSGILFKSEIIVNPGTATVDYSLTNLNNGTSFTGTATGVYGMTMPSDSLPLVAQIAAINPNLGSTASDSIQICISSQYISRPNG